MEDLQRNTVFEDIVEKAHRATNQIKAYLNYNDYDGLISFVVNYLSGLLNSNKRVHYKILKMKFIHLLIEGNACQANEIYFKHILPFVKEIFNYSRLCHTQNFFLSNLSETHHIGLKELLQNEKDYLIIKIFKPILLLITYCSVKSNSLPSSAINEAYSHLESKKIKYDYDIQFDANVSDIEEPDEQKQHSNSLLTKNITCSNDSFFGNYYRKGSGDHLEYYLSENPTSSQYDIKQQSPQSKFEFFNSKSFDIPNPKFTVKQRGPTSEKCGAKSINYLNDKSSIINSMTKNSFIKAPRQKQNESQTNYSTSSCKYSSFSEFNKSFKPGFDKKENVDKKIMRKFRGFLSDSYKKKSIDLSQTDKCFWMMFIHDNFLPPMKYNNPESGESVEFKSFSNNYLLWLFSKHGSFYLYEKFLEECGNSLYEKFIESSTKLAESILIRQQLLFYLKSFHSIYSREIFKNSTTPQSIGREYVVNYLGNKNIIWLRSQGSCW